MTLSRIRRSRFMRLWFITVSLLAVVFLAVCDGSPEHFGVSGSSDSAESTPTTDVLTPTQEPALTPSPVPTPTPTSAPKPEAIATPAETVETTPESDVPKAEWWGYRIVATYPHDPDAFTQGLEIASGVLYESTGLYGMSSLREVDLVTGEVRRFLALSDDDFGEGITILDGRIYQLTWESYVAYVYDLETFELLETFDIETQGWGLANDGEQLIMSNGSTYLYFRDPATFEEIRRIQVRDERGPVRRLNELEFVGGDVYANVLYSDHVARIDPETGYVLAWIDLTGLLQEEDRAGRRVDVLNGIAYDRDTGRLFVTGKWWPALYEIELIPPPSAE